MPRTLIALAALAACLSAAGAQEPRIAVARDLVPACQTYVAAVDGGTPAGQLQQDACRLYLMDFFRVYIQRQGLQQEQTIQGTATQPPEPAPCIRMPDFVSYPDLARKVTAYAAENPVAAQGPAYDLVFQTLAANFPCPEPEPRPGPG